jgi:hypothetical protein
MFRTVKAMTTAGIIAAGLPLLTETASAQQVAHRKNNTAGTSPAVTRRDLIPYDRSAGSIYLIVSTTALQTCSS